MVILDNGHGINTAGKRSPVWPDGSQVLEYAVNRQLVNITASYLMEYNIPFLILVNEVYDISLRERVRRANIMTRKWPNAFLVSIHCNAADSPNARGWCAYTSKGETPSDRMASVFYQNARMLFEGHRIRTDYADGDPDFEDQFYILRKTTCPAVLTENFFMTNREDCRLLQDNFYLQKIGLMHARSIVQIHNSILKT